MFTAHCLLNLDLGLEEGVVACLETVTSTPVTRLIYVTWKAPLYRAGSRRDLFCEEEE